MNDRPSASIAFMFASEIMPEAGRAEPGMRRAGFRQPPLPLFRSVDGQAPLQGAVRGGGHPGLVQDPQAVEFAGRLDDPRQHQMPEHRVAACGVLQPQRPVRAFQGAEQVPHPAGGDRQRPAFRKDARMRAALCVIAR